MKIIHPFIENKVLDSLYVNLQLLSSQVGLLKKKEKKSNEMKRKELMGMTNQVNVRE